MVKEVKDYPIAEGFACLNGTVLKLIAVATMLIDHIGAILFPGQMLFRYIGRIAFPLFVFLLVEGFLYTRSVRKYEIRLLIFALISEVPFDLAFNGSVLEFSSQNVFFTLLLGLILLDLCQTIRKRLVDTAGMLVELALLFGFMIVASLLRTDYSAGGILLIYCFYKLRELLAVKYILLAGIAFLFFGSIELFCILAVIPMLMYNGKRGFRQNIAVTTDGKRSPLYQLIRYLFYIFYPAHLLILHFIAVAIR